MKKFISLFFLFVCNTALACEWKANAVSYEIAAELKEESQQIIGSEKVTIQNRSCQSLDKLYFHIYPNAFRWEMDGTYAQEAMKIEDPENHFLKYGRGAWLKVQKILNEKDSTSLSFEINKELLIVTLPMALVPNEVISLNLNFITQMAPIAERSGTWDGNYSISQWFPKLMVFDKNGWALEHNAGYHYIGEFYGDFGTYDVTLITPKKMVVGATGHKVSETILQDKLRKQSKYHAENVHDFAWVADRHFIERTILSGKTKIHILTRHPETQVIGEYAQSALEYYGQRIGTYPYDDFTVAETYYNGPMEFPQIIFIRSWPSRFPRWFERDATQLLELAVTHETSHQWFFGVVGNNEVVNAWLDEGFATYLEESYMRDTYGDDQNILKFTSLFHLSDTQLSKIIWRLEEPDISQPIQTPSYLFKDPTHYYASAYYKTWLFFRQFEALIGREKFDKILRSYYKNNSYKNAVPENWYETVKKNIGAEAENWWKNWITTVVRSDYAIGEVKSQKKLDGTYDHIVQVKQLGNHFVPVDVEVIDASGTKYRQQAAISEKNHSLDINFHTKAAFQQATVDPDQVAPDVDRFNNSTGLLPKIKVWPYATKILPADAVALFPLPYFDKRPGIGYETGFYTGITHYLDWLGEFVVARDWRHKIWDINTTIETLEPNQTWGWAIDFTRDVLSYQGNLMAKRVFGPEVGHDPSANMKLGAVYFGDLGDGRSSAGVGASYTYSNIDNGKRFRYSATIGNSIARGVDYAKIFDRFSTELHVNITLEHWIKLDVRNFFGYTLGSSGESALFDLQAETEGRMRFDDKNLGQFKFKKINPSNFELQFPMPYGTYVDSLSVIHGPSWEWHLFSDVNRKTGTDNYFFDAGLGTRLYVISETFGRLGFNFEFVPYQNILNSGHFSSPIFIFNMISTR